jgi:hypothetical protein
LSYLDDDGIEWGEDVAYETLLDEAPQLADDAEFQARWADMFDESGNFDDMRDAFERLEDYLADEYDLNLDDYMDWEDWRAEHMDS